MKNLLKKVLLPLAIIACAWTDMPAKVSHLRLAPSATQLNTCSPNLQIETVKYLGKNNGNDSVQVTFNGQPPTSFSGNFNSGSASSCVTYGVPLINQAFGGISSSNQGFQPGLGGVATFGYELTVTITRRLGNQDTGTAKSSSLFNGQVTTVVQIPRGVVETDPVKYDVTIKTTFGGVVRRILTAQGNGAPALANSTQSFANTSLTLISGNCFPTVGVTALAFTPGSGTTPDSVSITWNASRSLSDCLGSLRVLISVEVKRADNSIGRGVIQPTAANTNVVLSGSAGTPVSFIVRVSAETSLGKEFQVNKKGEFQ